MNNLDELFKIIKKKVDYAEKENKEIQIKMLYDLRSSLIRTKGKDKESKEFIFYTGKAEGIAESLRKYFSYTFEDLSVGDTSVTLPTNFRVVIKKVENAITKISEGRFLFY